VPEEPAGKAEVVVKAVAVHVFGGSVERTRTVRNKAAGKAVTLSRSPAVVAAKGYVLAVGAEVRVTLSPGEALYAICEAAAETTLEVI
jgi:hypothetical protein